MNDTLKQSIIELQNSIEWSNWEDDEGKYFKLGSVLWNKIQWTLEGSEHLDEEYVYILEDIQKLICPILNELDKELNGE